MIKRFNPHASCEARRADLAREIEGVLTCLNDKSLMELLMVARAILRIQQRG